MRAVAPGLRVGTIPDVVSTGVGQSRKQARELSLSFPLGLHCVYQAGLREEAYGGVWWCSPIRLALGLLCDASLLYSGLEDPAVDSGLRPG